MTSDPVPSSTGDPALARAAHRALEPLHTLIYFVPEAGERYVAAGLKGGMRQYFASRSAAMGKVPAEVVIATFYNFAPSLVRRAIPSAWEDSTPEALLAARLDAADAALRRLLGDEVVDSPDLAEAAALAREATAAADIVGRPLFAAHAALDWPGPAHLQLWHAATLLREHRGDGHIAALVLGGLSGPEAVVSYVATGKSMPEDLMRSMRGYDEQEWADIKAMLRRRGLVDDDFRLTTAGQALRDGIEAQTDVAASAPYDHLGADKTRRLIELVKPWARSVNQQLFG